MGKYARGTTDQDRNEYEEVLVSEANPGNAVSKRETEALSVNLESFDRRRQGSSFMYFGIGKPTLWVGKPTLSGGDGP